MRPIPKFTSLIFSILTKKKKSLKLLSFCNQNMFCFCWLKWIFHRFKFSIHLFFSRLKSNSSWSELTRPEPDLNPNPNFFSSNRTWKKKFSTRPEQVTEIITFSSRNTKKSARSQSMFLIKLDLGLFFFKRGISWSVMHLTSHKNFESESNQSSE